MSDLTFSDKQDVNRLLDYYANLLIIQYNCKPKATQTIKSLLQVLLAENVYNDILNGYDINTAVGKQLDILGQYIGSDRFFAGFEFTGTFFGFDDAFNQGTTSTITGFDDAFAATPKDGVYLDAFDFAGSDVSLSDTNYRTLLRLKILQNHINHSTGSIEQSLNDTFGNDIFMTDNLDMTMTYFVKDIPRNLANALLDKRALPKPTGVKIDNVFLGTEFYGFADAFNIDKTPDFVVGLDDAFSGTQKSGVFFDSNDIIRL